MKKILIASLLLLLVSCSPGSNVKKIDPARPYISVEFSFNTASYHSFIKKFYPQIAVWIKQGELFPRTAYVTAKGAKNDWFGADRRPSALPVWRGIHPPGRKAIDATSGATPSGTTYRINWNIPTDMDPNKQIKVFIEANISFDYNATWPEKAPEGSPGYSGVNGQPSLIWQGTIDRKSGKTDVKPQLIGHGSVTGKDSRIYPGLKGITSAKNIFTYIRIRYHEPEKKEGPGMGTQ